MTQFRSYGQGMRKEGKIRLTANQKPARIGTLVLGRRTKIRVVTYEQTIKLLKVHNYA